MARYCSRCNRKFGFFEEDFDGMCKDCLEKKQEEERNRILQEYKEKEAKRKLEEQRKLEEKRKLEEEKRLQMEKEQKEQEEKYISFQNKYMYNTKAIQLYINIIEMMNKYIPINVFQNEDDHPYYWANAINLFIKDIICRLPNSFKLEDIENINATYIFEDIMSKNETVLAYKINQQTSVGYQKKNTKEPVISIDFENNLFLAEFNIDKLEDRMQELKQEIYNYEIKEIKRLDNIINSIAGEGTIKRSYTDITVNNKCLCLYYNIFYWALVYIYNIIFFTDYIESFEKSELNTLFLKLQENTDDFVYVADKIYELYLKLYTKEFDIRLSKNHIYKLIMFEIWNTNLAVKEIRDIVHTKINKELKDITKDESKEFCIKLFKENNIQELLIKENYIEYFICELLNKFIQDNTFNFDDIISYKDNFTQIVKKLKEEENVIEAQKERDRILNGDFSKEIEMKKQEVEYSNVQNGYEFEEYVANLYEKLGYTIEEVTKKSGDQGADIIVYKDNIKYVIQVKFYNNPVGNKAVQEVVGAIGMYNANKGIVVTNSTFTPQAIELANANNIELIDGEKIEQFKRKIVNDITVSEVDSDNEEKEYVQNIFKIWKDSIDNFEDVERKIMFLGTTYYSMETDLLNNEKVEDFVNLIIKYKHIDEEVEKYVNTLEIETLNLFIGAGVFTGYILEELKSKECDNKYEAILDIYINAPDIVEKPLQVLALSKMLGLDIEETANAIADYIDNYTDDDYDEEDDDFDY